MVGTKEGGIKAAASNRLIHGPDFYRRIGRKGGRSGHTGGFAANPALARLAGAKGGRRSSRTFSLDKLQAGDYPEDLRREINQSLRNLPKLFKSIFPDEKQYDIKEIIKVDISNPFLVLQKYLTHEADAELTYKRICVVAGYGRWMTDFGGYSQRLATAIQSILRAAVAELHNDDLNFPSTEKIKDYAEEYSKIYEKYG